MSGQADETDVERALAGFKSPQLRYRVFPRPPVPPVPLSVGEPELSAGQDERPENAPENADIVASRPAPALRLQSPLLVAAANPTAPQLPVPSVSPPLLRPVSAFVAAPVLTAPPRSQDSSSHRKPSLFERTKLADSLFRSSVTARATPPITPPPHHPAVGPNAPPMSVPASTARTPSVSLANYVPTPQLNGDVYLRAMESAAEQPANGFARCNTPTPLEAGANDHASKSASETFSSTPEILLRDLLRALAEPKDVQRDLTEPSAALRDVFRRL